VAEFDLLETPDRDIWDFALKGDFVIVTTDADFYELAVSIGSFPQSSMALTLVSSHPGC
jgi:predicted nuclease of predicted toxin-antitoxin system